MQHFINLFIKKNKTTQKLFDLTIFLGYCNESLFHVFISITQNNFQLNNFNVILVVVINRKLKCRKICQIDRIFSFYQQIYLLGFEVTCCRCNVQKMFKYFFEKKSKFSNAIISKTIMIQHIL